jgi:hypothetical protein
MLREGGNPTGGSDNRIEEYAGDGGRRVIFSRFEKQGDAYDKSGVQPGSTPFVAWANRNVGVESAAGEIYTGSPTQKIDTGLVYSVGTATLSLFRGFKGDHMEGNIHGFVFVVGGLSVQKRADLNTYMQERAGVTL